MSIEEKLASQIGALILIGFKKDAVIEALKAELDKRNEIIRKLNEAEPPLPLAEPQKEARNGAH